VGAKDWETIVTEGFDCHVAEYRADGKQRVYGMDTVYLRPAPSTKWTRDLVDSAHLRTDQEGKYV
jgi:hypothetical protein